MTDTKVKWNNLHWSGQLQDLWHCRPAFTSKRLSGSNIVNTHWQDRLKDWDLGPSELLHSTGWSVTNNKPTYTLQQPRQAKTSTILHQNPEILQNER